MKNYLLILITMLLVAGISCQPKVDVEKEKEAILKVLKDEADVFANYDMESLSSMHVQSKMDARLAGTKLYNGWDEIKTLLESYMERNRNSNDLKNMRNEKENVLLKVTGTSAWVICDNIWKWEMNNKSEISQNIQISFLEKIDGVWKFSFNAFVASPKDETQNIIGSWKWVSGKHKQDGKIIYDFPEITTGDAVKVWSANYFSVTGKVIHEKEVINYHVGGTYTLSGNHYTENIQFSSNENSVGAKPKMILKIKNDTLYQTWPVDANGILDEDNLNIEKWVRLK